MSFQLYVSYCRMLGFTDIGFSLDVGAVGVER